MLQIRNLRAEDVECRVGQISREDKTNEPKGLTLLLYKTSRTDMDILDETVGAERWQDKFCEIKGNLYCSIGIEFNGQWIWKGDCGVPSNVEAEKGEASDARKRAGVAWGIGRELYTSPFIYIDAGLIEWTPKGYPKGGFEVTEFEVTNKKITKLAISYKHRVVFTFGTSTKVDAPKPKEEPKPAPKAEPKPAPKTEVSKARQVMDFLRAQGLDAMLVTNWTNKYADGAKVNDLSDDAFKMLMEYLVAVANGGN